MIVHKLIGLVTVGVAAMSGCNGVAYQPGVPIHRPDLARALRETACGMYPKAIRAMHRVILTIRGQEIVLTGIIRIKSDGTTRLAAVHDFGKTVFCVSRWPDGRTTVERGLLDLRESWLTDGPLRDVEAIYVRKPPREASLEQREGGLVSLVACLPSGQREDFRFEPASRRLVSYLRVRGSRCLYEIDYSDYGVLPTWPHEIPRTITITDHLLGYRVQARVVALESLPEAHGSPEDKP